MPRPFTSEDSSDDESVLPKKKTKAPGKRKKGNDASIQQVQMHGATDEHEVRKIFNKLFVRLLRDNKMVKVRRKSQESIHPKCKK